MKRHVYLTVGNDTVAACGGPYHPYCTDLDAVTEFCSQCNHVGSMVMQGQFKAQDVVEYVNSRKDVEFA